MNNTGFRPLLPAIRPPLPPPDPKPKKKRLTIACDVCRQRKGKCDGSRPTCTACRERGSDCKYGDKEDIETSLTISARDNIALREKVVAHQDILALLGKLPQYAAQVALQRLEPRSDPIATLRMLKGENLGSLPSAQGAARAILPPIHSDYELELLVRHPIAYPPLDLSHHAQITGSTLADPSAPPSYDIPSHVSPASPSPGSARLDDLEAGESFQCRYLEHINSSEESRRSTIQFADSRLANLNIEFWTPVSLSNAQAAGAISWYLETQHPVWGVFDAGLFVHDLVNYKFDFCSPFMVSSLLAIALQCYAFADPHACENSYAFESAAEKLLQAETVQDTLPTISGLALLFISIAVHGDGLRGKPYLLAARGMAERMQLFGIPNALETLNSASREKLAATSRTAWGLFNIIVLQGTFYLMPPVQYPPSLSIYADSTELDSTGVAQEEADIYSIHSAFCKLWVIVNEVLLVYRDHEHKAASLAFALTKYHSLLQLAEQLKAPLIRKRQTLNHTLVFHMIFHLMVLDIFRPFIAPEKQHDFKSYMPRGISPTSTFAASVRQLKGLFFEYEYQCPPSRYTPWAATALTHVASAVLNNALDPERRPYFFFYIRFGQQLGRSYRVVTKMMKALLAIAHDKDAITAAEVARFTAGFKDHAGKVSHPKNASGFLMDMDLAVKDTVAADVDNLAGRYEEIALFDEFIVESPRPVG